MTEIARITPNELKPPEPNNPKIFKLSHYREFYWVGDGGAGAGVDGLVKERRRVILVTVFSAARETARTWSPRSPTKAMSSSEMRESRRASGSFLGPLSWRANSGLKCSRYQLARYSREAFDWEGLAMTWGRSTS